MKVVDMHCDTLSALLSAKRQGKNFDFENSDTQISLSKMQAGDYLLQNFAIFVNLGETDSPLPEALEMILLFESEMEKHADLIRPVRSYADIEQNQADGVMSALLTGEEGEITMGNPDFLYFLYKLGMRMMTLTWNYENSLGFPNVRLDKKASASSDRYCLSQNKGLKEQGIVFLEEMERLGMIIDVSHLSDAGFYDVLEHTTKPFVASHSNARALARHPRNLTDEMIRALADRGGVAGINYFDAFVKDRVDGKAALSLCRDMVAHMKHMKQVGGIGCIGLGSDFDGFGSPVEMKDCSGMQLLADEMSREGFSTGEIEAVFSENVLRVYKELL